jgi:starch phosphorylase
MVGQTQLVDKLRELARNLWWTWQPNVITLFRELDPALWRKVDHNPVEFLKRLPAEQLERRAAEMALDSRIDYAFRRLAEYLRDTDSWGSVRASILRSRPVAYFSAEFGLHESLPIYSGGLGVLAGDHLKSASDLGIPLIGVGLLYAEGYFRQTLDADGWQQELYLNADLDLLPIESVTGPDQQPLLVSVNTATGVLHARVWRVGVGRTTLLLLDSNVPQNTESDRSLTARLYGGDARVRIRQELMLGVGGLRALHALGIHPAVLHLNEGHSAFATLEMTRSIMETNGMPFGEVVRDVSAMTVFTTHTPVAAGHDRFPAPLVEEHLGKLRESLHLSYDDFMGLGRVHPGDPNEPFCLTVLALKLSRFANGVSALHGSVSRRMWHPLYGNTPEENVPIGHITNGIHVQSWVAPQMHLLFERHLGTDWTKTQRHPETWVGIDTVDDAELWENQQVMKARLINFVRNRLVAQARRRREPESAIDRAMQALDLNALTIGFARRFATYKRSGLILQDAERLIEMVNSSDWPIQIIFGGKAHPEDRMGKELIQNIARVTRREPFASRIVFVEDYDMNVARQLVQGVDVWLNNPRRPQEASGTSGQKAALNGTLNCSILDGWWAEAYDGTNGFAIGMGQTHAVPSVQDERDHRALIETLTNQVIPLYYKRDDATGLPRAWIARQKNAFRTLAWRFNADRMVMDYVQRGYLPAAGGVSCAMPRS